MEKREEYGSRSRENSCGDGGAIEELAELREASPRERKDLLATWGRAKAQTVTDAVHRAQQETAEWVSGKLLDREIWRRQDPSWVKEQADHAAAEVGVSSRLLPFNFRFCKDTRQRQIYERIHRALKQMWGRIYVAEVQQCVVKKSGGPQQAGKALNAQN